MDFGIFIEERRKGTSEADAFREARELADAAEAWGLDGVWLGEIHFNPMRSVQSSPIALASFIAARTRRVRVGTAVQVLPLSNPLRIAEDIATVDHLSEGRFDFGVGRSGSPRAYMLRDELGLNGVIAELNPGGLLSMEQMQRTLRILTHEVAPALK